MENQPHASHVEVQKVLRQRLTESGVDEDSLSAIDALLPDFWRDSDARTLVQHAAGILKYEAPLLRVLNIVLEIATASLAVVEADPESPSDRIFVVLFTENGTYAEILRFPPSPNLDSVYMTTTSLRSSLYSVEFDRRIHQLSSSMASCVMDVLLLEFKLSVSPAYKRTCSHYLRLLSNMHTVLPPSFLIYNAEQDSRFPVACGGFADIYMGRLNSSPVCLKVLRYFYSATDMDRKRLIKLFCREALSWRRLNHPNILPFLGVAADLFNPSFCLVSPWMRNGNIMSFLEKNPIHDRLKAITEIALAIKYLHEYDPPIVHGDIRGANILVTDDLRCCLTDFGLASVNESQVSSMASHGTLRWTAPEYLQSDAPSFNLPPRDIYAFGCTILEIYTGRLPFHYHRSDGIVIHQVLTGKRPRRDDIQPDSIWSLIEACWDQDPNRRPSARNVFTTLLSEIPSTQRGNLGHSADDAFYPSSDEDEFGATIVPTSGNMGQHSEEISLDNLGSSIHQPGDLAELIESLQLAEGMESETKPHQPLMDDEGYLPWYLRPNYDQTEVFIEPDGSVRGGTINALVEQLTAHDHADPTYTQAFLMTFKSFTTLDELFDRLVQRFRIQPPLGLTPRQHERWTQLKQVPIRVRVLNIFKSMVVEPDILDKEDLDKLDRMKEFISTDEVHRFGGVKELLVLIEQAQKGGRKIAIPTSQTATPQPIIPKGKQKLKLMDIDPLELARQLTLYESQLYQKIKPIDCLLFVRERKAENNITTVVQTSNRVCDWVVDSILCEEDPRKRVIVVKQLITVADHCRTLNNFSTMIAITAGLNAPAIRRLKRTWEQIGQRMLVLHGACEMTIEPNRNFVKYRSLMATVKPPCVPFVGISLSVFQFIQDGNPDNLPGGLINFKKRQRVSEAINDIKRWQSRSFNFVSIPLIQAYIEESLSKYSEPDSKATSEQFWELSLDREPREREDERTQRSLWEGFL